MTASAGERYQVLLVQAVLSSCRVEIQALKPGNVSIYSEGHGMTADDFFYSAELIAPIITRPGLSVGERVLRSVEITRAKLGCNTNLGIILLGAPLVHAMFFPHPPIPSRQGRGSFIGVFPGSAEKEGQLEHSLVPLTEKYPSTWTSQQHRVSGEHRSRERPDKEVQAGLQTEQDSAVKKVLRQEGKSGGAKPSSGLQNRLVEVLRNLDKRDAALAFQAIRLASPAGLGRSEHQDVHSEPTVTLREVMAVAQGWDRIAYQYANNFEDVFASGLPCIRQYLSRWSQRADSFEWATVGCYLNFLATIPDSHIQRKFGKEQAQWVQDQAKRVEKRFKACQNPDAAIPLLLQFDRELKQEGVNPGTSADLTVASLLAFHLDHLLGDVLNSRTTVNRGD